mmetsp:Transcript_5113/g.11314  ORF Transcript_5113/g.11314 Transcript_5113/m.11314 type:complete len:438 (+) Transcript_5113:141-1454(+)
MSGDAEAARRRRGSNARDSGPLDLPLLVLKVGTSTLMVSDEAGQRVQLANVAQLVELIGALKRKKYHVVLVSSGAVGMGCIKLGLAKKPTSLRIKQAVAAAGQSQLMRMYEDLFGTVRVQVAQILISQSDFMEKQHWSNVKHTVIECLKLGVVPIINENDCTNTEELRFGDNDNLAALTAVQLEASGLFLFTDVDFLYTANPRTDPSATPLRVVSEPWALQVDTREPGSGFGTGGMATKIVAARTASTAGIPCGLIHGAHSARLHTFLDYEADQSGCALPEGTYFLAMPAGQTVGDTRRWILSLPTSGELVVDDGAARALSDHKSLLPIGIRKVQGSFLRNEGVKVMHRGAEVARGIVNFAAEELEKVIGKRSGDFEELLGYTCAPEACHRSNIILTVAAESLRSFDVPGKLPQASEASHPSGKAGGISRSSSTSSM